VAQLAALSVELKDGHMVGQTDVQKDERALQLMVAWLVASL
jgi:hypothetical protein